ncbi:ABC-type amino acid transport substrate-binding protein [Micromonospora pallida]|uniref:ABC-type amino acid transport substrate-binding protein n=1 Tax=Micromonospora pallida TaxID=145854 RepID=A0A1C6RQX9_9ACTN|nr:transporter substrate-binding domain-containing protein [Micromonospora pallida]SCL19586.1 ABC-type amino acid transport substrate-binding protein [Micromonospora pallida]
MAEPDRAPVPRTGQATSLVRELFWVVPTVLAAVGGTVFLLSNRAWGADAAAIIGFPLSVVAIIVAILIDRGAFKAPFLKVPRDRRRTWKWAAAFTVVVMLGTVTVWWIRREPDPFDYLSGEVRIGYVAYEYQGWHTDDSSGVPEGFDVDLARDIEAHFPDARISWVDLTTVENRILALRGEWSKAGSRVRQDPVKLVVSNFSMTPERAERIDFAGPYFVDAQAFLSRDPSITTISKIPRGRVCVLKGSRSDEKLTQIGWNPLREDSLAACVAEYHADRVDAVSDDRSLIAGFAKAIGLPPPSPLNYGAEKYGVGMPDNMPRLCAEVSKVIDDFLKYRWSDSFRAHLTPFGLSEERYVRPTSTDPCQPAAPWYD